MGIKVVVVVKISFAFVGIIGIEFGFMVVGFVVIFRIMVSFVGVIVVENLVIGRIVSSSSLGSFISSSLGSFIGSSLGSFIGSSLGSFIGLSLGSSFKGSFINSSNFITFKKGFIVVKPSFIDVVKMPKTSSITAEFQESFTSLANFNYFLRDFKQWM